MEDESSLIFNGLEGGGAWRAKEWTCGGAENGGEWGMVRCCCVDSPVGVLCLAAESGALVGLWMEGQRFFGEPYDALPPCGEPCGVLAEAAAWLEAYWAGMAPSPSVLPLAPRGTAFRQRVWRALSEIPYGGTCSYGELAAALGSSPRAVGGAVGHNPISIIIPCHRVTGAGGVLMGYAGGTARQRLLLERECPGVDAENQHEVLRSSRTNECLSKNGR